MEICREWFERNEKDGRSLIRGVYSVTCRGEIF